MRTALAIEIEELVFDTMPLRASALRDALAQEGVILALHDVVAAHSGVTALMALSALDAASQLDDVGRDLVLRRAEDAASASLERALPVFDPEVRDRLASLATAFPVAVVTRGSRRDAQRMLDAAGLHDCMNAVRSLAGVPEAGQHDVWADAVARLGAEGGVAIASPRMLAAAARAGLRTVQIGTPTADGTDGALVSLAQLDASYIVSLF